jgi:hypothetical protein
MVRGKEWFIFAKNFFWMCMQRDKRRTNEEGIVKGERDCIVAIHACDVRCELRKFFFSIMHKPSTVCCDFSWNVYFMQNKLAL